VVEEGVRQVSTLLANLAVGFLSGGIGGALVGFLLQRVGRVSCVVSEWEPEFYGEFREKTTQPGRGRLFRVRHLP
jgi:hypothetical protein